LVNGPGEELLPENIIIDLNRKVGKLEVDVSKYNIELPVNGIYVGLEWLGESENNKVINIHPGFSCSKHITSGFDSRISFFGRPFVVVNSKYNNDLYVPMFGIIIN